MLPLVDLKPLTGEEMLAFTFGHRGVTTMAVEQAVHLMARRNAFEDFTDSGEVCMGGSSWPGRTDSASGPPDHFVTSVLHHTSSPAASKVRRVKGRGTRAKLHP
ncbi:hypothetical protein [Bradyrhizobium elkanii]|uniref:hypothetical protein n=1 Tax=Bradyrhizobium elkanii TaxID=29448 RepID=UPI002FF41C9E